MVLLKIIISEGGQTPKRKFRIVFRVTSSTEIRVLFMAIVATSRP